MPRKVRQIRIEGNIAYVPLTKNKTAIIDAEDAPKICGWNWSAYKGGRNFYAFRCETKNGKNKHVSMHRLILCAKSNLHVDHIDGNGLNNRKENLRMATRSQNQYNSRRRVDNPSGYKGVRSYKDTGKWQARITANKKQYHLGYFDTAEEAHKAYCEASKKLHGEFSRLT
jgi:hypothetical protein